MYSFIACKFCTVHCVYNVFTRVCHFMCFTVLSVTRCVSLLERFTTVETFACHNFDSTQLLLSTFVKYNNRVKITYQVSQCRLQYMLLELTVSRACKTDKQATARLHNDSFIARSNVCFAKILAALRYFFVVYVKYIKVY